LKREFCYLKREFCYLKREFCYLKREFCYLKREFCYLKREFCYLKTGQLYPVCSTFRPQLHDTRFASERHQILQFQGEFSSQNYDNITELVKNFK
jgi:hypothetical protein